MTRRSIITGCGAYLPERVVTNHELAAVVDTSDDWIVERTGIRERRIAADNEFTSDLARNAAIQAMQRAGASADRIDLVIVATTTPDLTFPATATQVQGMLGMTHGAAFDLQAVCSGFVYALAVADNFIRCGQADTAVVIGAETFSRILDWSDRSTCVLFGDGAGAVVLQASNGTGSTADRGVLSTHLHSDGTKVDLLCTDGGPSRTRGAGRVRMAGREVFRHAVVSLAEVVEETLNANGLGPEAIDWLVPHQANQRIIDSTRRKLGLPEEKVVLTIERHANTSAASIPLALEQATTDGRIKAGDLVLLEAMGGGLSWGAVLVRM